VPVSRSRQTAASEPDKSASPLIAVPVAIRQPSPPVVPPVAFAVSVAPQLSPVVPVALNRRLRDPKPIATRRANRQRCRWRSVVSMSSRRRSGGGRSVVVASVNSVSGGDRVSGSPLLGPFWELFDNQIWKTWLIESGRIRLSNLTRIR